jgi:hypothetical protein
MATIKFYTDNGFGDPFDIDIFGSGLGFFGAGGFSGSVAVNSWQDNTFVTNANGNLEGPQANNVKWTHANSGEYPTDINLHLQDIPNSKATLNVRFTHTSSVQVQNVELRIYDRTTITAGASGVTTRTYETLHPSSTTTGKLGSGETAWTTPAGDSPVQELAQSPGISGVSGADGDTSTVPSERHDWYVCMSARPDSIGSKTEFGMYVSLEYL